MFCRESTLVRKSKMVAKLNSMNIFFTVTDLKTNGWAFIVPPRSITLDSFEASSLMFSRVILPPRKEVFSI